MFLLQNCTVASTDKVVTADVHFCRDNVTFAASTAGGNFAATKSTLQQQTCLPFLLLQICDMFCKIHVCSYKQCLHSSSADFLCNQLQSRTFLLLISVIMPISSVAVWTTVFPNERITKPCMASTLTTTTRGKKVLLQFVFNHGKRNQTDTREPVTELFTKVIYFYMLWL